MTDARPLPRTAWLARPVLDALRVGLCRAAWHCVSSDLIVLLLETERLGAVPYLGPILPLRLCDDLGGLLASFWGA
jgi:hypothetical protein